MLNNIEFSEELIKSLYCFYLEENVQPDSIQYRTEQITPKESMHSIAKPEDLAHLMQHYIGQITTSSYSLSAIEVAAFAYKRFLDIYPFDAYNEETGMAIASVLLQKAGYFFNGIPACLQNEFKKAIQHAQKTGMPDDLITVFSKAVNDFIN